MSLVHKTRVSILKNFFVFLFLTVLMNSFFISVVEAENIETYFVTSGVDQSSGIAEIFTEDDVEKLTSSDSVPGNGIDRYRSDKWPDENAYDEDRYIEYIFTPNIPAHAVINEVKIHHEFQRSAALGGAKIEIWDGSNFVEIVGITLGSSAVDHTDVLDATSVLNTANIINNTKIRFLAYRSTSTASGTTTGHDFVSLIVTYTLPEPEDPPTDSSTEVLNDITEDTTWTKEGSPYILNQDVSVASGATLTVEPGVVVEFNSNIFLVEGIIKVLGTEDDPVYLNGAVDFVIADTSGNSVLNHTINRSNLFVFYDGGQVDSDGFDTDTDILFFESDSDFLNLKSGSLYLYDNSEVEINSADILGDIKIEVEGSSNLSLKNSKIESTNLGDVVSVFNNSSASFDNVDIKSLSQASSNFSVFGGSSASFKDGASEGSHDGFLIYNDSNISIENTDIACNNTGISVYNNSVLNFDTGSVNCGVNGVSLFNDVQVDIKNIKVHGASDSGFVIFNNFEGSLVNIKNSEITDNLYGFMVYDSVFSASHNNIHNNILSGAFTFLDVDLDFKNNYWGDSTGPFHIDSNPDGSGDIVSDNITFYPWLLSWPPVEECLDCSSNVMFFPGAQASRLYGDVTDCDVVVPNACSEQQLWVSNNKILHEEMFLDEFGKSLNDVYTKNDTESIEGDGGERGVIDEILTLNIYKSFIGDLRTLKKDDVINDYKLIPYDWRLSLQDIITNGKVVGENLSYREIQDFSQSFILNQLRQQALTSKTGKVTLIAHSTGGLVIKALIQKLKDTNDPLYDKIDKIIFVAVPQVGTPEATIAMLHGIPLGYGILMPTDRSRQLGENMPTVYNLAPSSAYFDTVDTNQSPLIIFPEHSLFQEQIERYGTTINTKAELKDYILGGDGRIKPDIDDTDKPNIGNTYLYEQAENIHQIIDSWQPSPNTKIIEVAGWGEETKVGLKYVVKKKFFGLGGEYISYKPIKVVDGDSTVAFPSALWMENNENVEEWYVNLKKFNKGDIIFRDNHKNILEIQNLRNFIQDKIKNVITFSDLENIVVRDKSTLVSDGTRLHFTLHSPLTLGITDSEGRYTGLVPETGEIKEEVPDVNYDSIGTVQFISVPVGIPYTLKLDGYEEGSFTLDVEKQEGNNITQEYYFEAIPSSDKTLAYLDIGTDFEILNSKLKVDTDGDGAIDEIYPKLDTIEPVVVVPPGAVVLVNNNYTQKDLVQYLNVPYINNTGIVLGADTQIDNNNEIYDIEKRQEEKALNKNINTEAGEPKEELSQNNNKQENSVPAEIMNENKTNKNIYFYVIILSILGLCLLIKKLI